MRQKVVVSTFTLHWTSVRQPRMGSCFEFGKVKNRKKERGGMVVVRN